MKTKTIFWILITLWCGFIFSQSHTPADISQLRSLAIVAKLNALFASLFGPGAITISDHFVRKSAHFLEYFLLGSLLFNGFLDRINLRSTMLKSFLFGALYALSDEIHQAFIPGRSMRFSDVVIDSAGVLAGILLLAATLRHFRANSSAGSAS